MEVTFLDGKATIAEMKVTWDILCRQPKEIFHQNSDEEIRNRRTPENVHC